MSIHVPHLSCIKSLDTKDCSCIVKSPHTLDVSFFGLENHQAPSVLPSEAHPCFFTRCRDYQSCSLYTENPSRHGMRRIGSICAVCTLLLERPTALR